VQVQWGFDHLSLTAASLKALGAEGLFPWGVVTFASGCLWLDQVGHRCGRSGGPQTLPLLSQPVTPIIARVVKQPLTTPEPTDPVRHSPWRPPLLAQWVCTHALPQGHLHGGGYADDPDQPGPHRLGRHVDYGRPDGPMLRPIPIGRFDRHPPGIRHDRLRHRRRGGAQDPGLGLALGRRAGRGRFPALRMRPMLGMTLGSRCPFAPRAGVLFMLRRGGDSGAHDDPARHQWRGGSTTA
jgi:hypothetical protein